MVNEVENLYNDFWQLNQQFQEHSGAVSTGTSLNVQYGYADGTGNSSRPTSVTYPNGNVLNLGYGSSGSPDDLLSRVTSLALGSDTVASYNFLGLGTPVIVEYPDPAIQYNLATGTCAESLCRARHLRPRDRLPLADDRRNGIGQSGLRI